MSYWGEYHQRMRTGRCVQASCPNRAIPNRVRCRSCAKIHADAERKRYHMAKKSNPPCQHCCRRAATRSRGLCAECYYRPEVRRLYPARTRESKETMEELDAMIAERYATMPIR
jgi:hypothetical protein